MEDFMMIAEVVRRMSVHAAILIIPVLTARFLLIHRLPKRTFSVLWTICALRALLPMFPEFPLSIQSLFKTAALQTLPSNASLFWEEEAGHGLELGNWIGEALSSSEEMHAMVAGGTPVTAAVIWLLGAILMGVYFLGNYVKYRRLFDMSLPLEQELAWNSGLLRKIRIRVSDRIVTPLSYGLFRPVILFPTHMDWEDEEAVELILAHETVHIRRFDGLLKGALAGALCLHWWNPLVWIMFFLGSRDAELACDEAVVLEGNTDLRTAYAMTLIRMEESRGTFGALYSHFSENAIEERITAIMKIKKTSMLAVVCALCLVVGLTMVFATSAPEEDLQEDGTTGEISGEIVLLWPGTDCDVVTMTFGDRTHPVTGEIMSVDHITISNSGGEALGTDVVASASGTVLEDGYDPNYGYYLVIDHGNGLVTKYSHCKDLCKTAGETVDAGEVIASVGQTGKVTGACLGFHVTLDGEAVDPELYFE